MAQIVYHTKLDKNGDLTFDRGDFEVHKMFTVVCLNKDPFKWCDIVRKDTDNLNKDFVKKFLDDNGLAFDKLSKLSEWFPFYYTTFLLESANCISLYDYDTLKDNLKLSFDELFGKGKMTAVVDTLPDGIDKDTTVGKLSDELNRLTQIDCMIPTYA